MSGSKSGDSTSGALISRLRVALFAAAAIAIVVILGGCSRASLLGQVTTPSYKPSNVYVEEECLPAEMKRVLVLPLTTSFEDAATEFGRETLWPILISELGRSLLFELVTTTPEELRVLTGRSSWSGEEAFPRDLFEKLSARFGVEGVMFCRLTQYRAYEPLSIGWRLKLFQTDEPRVLWAVDEVFDGKVPEVAAAARRFDQQHFDTGLPSKDSLSGMVSPRRFGQYSANAVVQTLPGRK